MNNISLFLLRSLLSVLFLSLSSRTHTIQLQPVFMAVWVWLLNMCIRQNTRTRIHCTTPERVHFVSSIFCLCNSISCVRTCMHTFSHFVRRRWVCYCWCLLLYFHSLHHHHHHRRPLLLMLLLRAHTFHKFLYIQIHWQKSHTANETIQQPNYSCTHNYPHSHTHTHVYSCL